MDSRALLDWYQNARPLPWRFTRDPYALLVSEVMLQQTQAARVVPYYEAFLARFPDPPALAAASPRDVLAAWSGLGYNRRALSLRAAAAVVADRGWPEDLTELPGVGPYTAAAVGSFAWDRQTVAVDTNVRRVIERHDGVVRGPKALAARAAELVPAGRAAAFNQAMMELGATVCRPRTPVCGDCPVSRGCAGHPDRLAAPLPDRLAAPVPDRLAAPLPDRPAAPRRHRPAAPHRHRPAASQRHRPAVRFEDTDRWARGRIVAALLAGEPVPPRITGERRERVLAALERDGLIVCAADGSPRLPAR
jgi:A/G-specific adenine glycosylase